jgi:hypothetical protein
LTVHEKKKEASLSCHAEKGNCSRHFIIDSGASFHLISREELSKKEAAQIRRMKKPIHLRSANGLTTATHDVELSLIELGNEKVVALVLEDTPSVLSLGKLCSENGYDYVWKNDDEPYLQKGSLKVKCRLINNVPIIIPSSALAARNSEKKQEEIKTQSTSEQAPLANQAEETSSSKRKKKGHSPLENIQEAERTGY